MTSSESHTPEPVVLDAKRVWDCKNPQDVSDIVSLSIGMYGVLAHLLDLAERASEGWDSDLGAYRNASAVIALHRETLRLVQRGEDA